MNCLACNSNRISARSTVISDFVAYRLWGKSHASAKRVTLNKCKDCGFMFYDKRLNDDENSKLYEGYRSNEYQEMRQKFEPWYTKEINDSIGKNETEIKNRVSLITNILNKNGFDFFDTALDFGGDKGQFFSDSFFNNKYVYDISGAEIVGGRVKLVNNYNDLRKLRFDFIMCNHVLEHIGPLDEFLESIKKLGTSDTIFYFEVPFDHLDNSTPKWKMFILKNNLLLFLINALRKKDKRIGIYGKMHEHINYFTEAALDSMLTRNGFQVIEIQSNMVDCGWTELTVISGLCRRKF